MFGCTRIAVSRLVGHRRRPVAFRPQLQTLEPRIVLSGEASAAFEIAYIGDLGADYTGPTKVYVAGGTNPITAEEWATYVPPPDYILNTTRNVQFDSSELFSSPDSTTEKTYITTSDGYTWLFIAQTVSANWPFDPADYPNASYSTGYEAAALSPTPPPGVVRWSDNTKNQEITRYARTADGRPIERYFITDPWGDRFIMQASGELDPALVRSNFVSAVLPQGWTKSVGYLHANLTTLPAYNADGAAHYYVFRDSADDSFQQISWGKQGWGTSQMIPGMDIWGGTGPTTIRTNPTRDNTVYAAGGNDRIYVNGLINTIHGDGGIDTAVFPKPLPHYTVTPVSSDGSEVIVSAKGVDSSSRVSTLFNIERYKFGCISIPVARLARVHANRHHSMHAVRLRRH